MSCKSRCGSRDKDEILCDGVPETFAASGSGHEIDGTTEELLEAELKVHEINQTRRPVELHQHVDVARIRFAARHRSKQPQVFHIEGPEGWVLPTQLIEDGDGGRCHGETVDRRKSKWIRTQRGTGGDRVEVEGLG